METYYALAVGFILRKISSGAFLVIGFLDLVIEGKHGMVDSVLKVPKDNTNQSIPFGRIISMGGAKLAYSSYRSKGRGNPSETWLVSSEDDGKSWNKISKFGSNDSNEATLCSFSENRILLLCELTLITMLNCARHLHLKMERKRSSYSSNAASCRFNQTFR